MSIFIGPTVSPPGQFNVRSYGALGNGVADDTAAIQAALTTAGNAGGGSVYLPSGTYLCKTTLTVPNFVRLFGDSPSQAILMGSLTNTATPLLRIGAAGAQGQFITLEGFSIDGVGATPGSHAIQGYYPTFVRIDVQAQGKWPHLFYAWNEGAAVEGAGTQQTYIRIVTPQRAVGSSPLGGIYIKGFCGTTTLDVDICGIDTGDGIHIESMQSDTGVIEITGLVHSIRDGYSVKMSGPGTTVSIHDFYTENTSALAGIDITSLSPTIGPNVQSSINLHTCDRAIITNTAGDVLIDSDCTNPVIINGGGQWPLRLRNSSPSLTFVGAPTMANAYGIGPTGFASNDSTNLVLNGDFTRWTAGADDEGIANNIWGFTYSGSQYKATKCGVGLADTTRTRGSPYCAKVESRGGGWGGAFVVQVVPAALLTGMVVNQPLCLSYKYKEVSHSGNNFGLSIIHADFTGLGEVFGTVPCENGFQRTAVVFPLTAAMIAQGIFLLGYVDESVGYLSEVSVTFGGSGPRDYVRNNVAHDSTTCLEHGFLVTYGTAAPVAGGDPVTGAEWQVGDKVKNTAPEAGGNMGWVCTGAGTPGTWKPFGTIGL